MVRVGGMRYTIDPRAAMGKRITRMELGGKPLEAGKTYKVAGWAPVSEEAKAARRRSDLGRVRALPARAEDDRAAQAQRAGDRGHERQSGHGAQARSRHRSARFHARRAALAPR